MDLNSFTEFWKRQALDWEQRRYEGLLSKIVYSSLHYRRLYVAFILEQLPPNSRVVELGCGSGRLFGQLKNRGDIQFVGYDISKPAIEAAKAKFSDYKNAQWICGDVANLEEIGCDICVSAGLLDWLSDEQIKKVLGQVATKNFVHSFSKKEEGIKTALHRLFSFYQSWARKAKYSPRKFTFAEVKNLIGSEIQFICNRDLSFGCFASRLDPSFTTNYDVFKNKLYFERKAGTTGFTEALVKKREAQIIKEELIKEDLASGLAGRTLEIGSGTGFYSKLLVEHGAQLTGVDGYVRTEDYFAHPRARFFNKVFEATAFSEKFSFVALLGVLEFVEDTSNFVAQIASVSDSKAQVMVLYPAKGNLGALFYRQFHRMQGRNLRFHSDAELTSLFERHGFRKLKMRKAGTVNNLFIFEKTGAV